MTMLKINLLPPHIYERRTVRRTALLFAFVFVGVVSAMIGWYVALGNRENQLRIEVAAMEQKANEVRHLEAMLAAERGRIPVIQSKVQFIENIMEYNLVYPQLYEELAKYTYSRVRIRELDPSPTSFRIQAHARSVGDCGRYLLNMYRATHLFSSVTIDSVPGWPNNTEASGFDFTVTGTLAKSITQPSYGGPAQVGHPGAPAAHVPPPADGGGL